MIRSLSATAFLEWLGASVMLPLLPVYLEDRGASTTTVGLVIAAFFAAGVVLQYPAGRLADRIGRRPVLLAGLICFSVASLGLALPLSPELYLVLRFVQGAGTGATTVATLALIGDAVPLAQRGRAFGSIYASQLAGTAVGPLIGSAIGAWSLSAVFAVGGVVSLAACLPLAFGALRDLPGPRRADESNELPSGAGPAPSIGRRVLIGALVAAAAFGLTVGVYETCWTLLLEHNGAANWQVGLSWTLFALPFIVMSRPGGWLADHLDRRRLAFAAGAVSLACCASYPFIPSLALLMALAAVEAVAIAVAIPAVQSLLTQSAPAERLGRVQGLFATVETAMVALAAGVSGSLFAAAVWAPFVIFAAAGGVLVLTLPAIWAPVTGRVPAPDVPPQAPESVAMSMTNR